MNLKSQSPVRAAWWLLGCLAWIASNAASGAQGFTTTTVQGTVYLANGQPGSGVLQLSWPAFTTANNQAIAAGRLNVQIGADGYVSVKLAPNLGSTPAGLYYTAVYHLADGTTSTEYWVVPAAAQASLAQVRAEVMPASQAVQAVSKGYVDQSITELTQSLLTASGGSLAGPLFLNADPSQPMQAATKRYVDDEVAGALPLNGGAARGPLTAVQLGAAYQVDQFSGADFGAKLQACLDRLDATYGGTCDARNFTGSQAAGATIVIATANATVQFPCATIATPNQIVITPGTRNVTLHGCSLRGASDASGSQGGTVFLYSGSGPMVQIGDPAYAVNTLGFHIDNVVVNTTPSSSSAAQAIAAYRTQELDLEHLYLLGNSNQTGMTLDGTGNYTGGTFQDLEFGGFGTALNAIGHQVANAATTDWVNASTFLRLHIDCPTDHGSPLTGTYGVNLLQGDGNTFTGGDIEGCATALHLGPNAQNNTIVGLRNENSCNQVVADVGSAYNNWMTGGTMFTGQLIDNGTRNSFLDTFHRSFNGLNGDWYGSQSDSTVTNHYRLGTGTGNERGQLNRYQTDSGYRWTMGLSDATSGEQFYQLLDELNNVNRLSIGQYNYGQSSTNNQTVVNSAGTGAVVLNGSSHAGTGGVIFGSGGPVSTTVATVNNAGNAQFNGTLQVGGVSTFSNSTTVKNQADAEIDSVLWAGTSSNQKESFLYKDYLGASQWYMVKDASNNWALNSAVGGLDSFKAYQSNNSGDTYINSSNGSGHIRLNYEAGAGSETDIYSGPSSTLVAAFLGNTAIKFPGLAASSGRNCLQIDNSGYISNTGAACATGGMNGTVNAGTSGQVAYYNGNGTVIAGTTSVGVGAGGTGATTAAQALQNLGAQPALPGVTSDGASGMSITGGVTTTAVIQANAQWKDIRHPSYSGGAVCDGVHDISTAINAAIASEPSYSAVNVLIPNGCTLQHPELINWGSHAGQVVLHVQGILSLGSTLTIPYGKNVSVIGEGGGYGAQFTSPPDRVQINVDGNAHGVLGTAVTVNQTGVIDQDFGVSQTFTPSTMEGLVVGAAISVTDTVTCNISSIARGSDGSSVTATLSGACHIPPGVVVKVAGVTDSSFNGVHTTGTNPGDFLTVASDYASNTVTWHNSGTANATSSGGTVIGFNEDSPEVVQITAVTSTTATAKFYRSHSSTARWGVVGIYAAGSGATTLLKGINVSSPGVQIYWGNYVGRMELVDASYFNACGSDPTANYYSYPVESWSNFSHFERVSFQGTCLPWSIHFAMPWYASYGMDGPHYIQDSFLKPGIKMDHGGYGTFISKTVCEECARALVSYDPIAYWNGASQAISIDHSLMQDNPFGYNPLLVYQLTPVPNSSATASVTIDSTTWGDYGHTNSYFTGKIVGAIQDAEIVGQGAGLGPSIIPYPTEAVPGSNWNQGYCSTTTSTALAPDGSNTATYVAHNTGNYYYIWSAQWGRNYTPAVGDRILFGGWESGSAYGGFYIDNGSNGPYHMNFNNTYTATGTYQTVSTGQWDTYSGSWHPAVGEGTVTWADGTANQNLRLLVDCSSSTTAKGYWAPFLIIVPASANVPNTEVDRWREMLLHGAVPPGMPAGALAMNPAHKLYWGSDTNLYRGAAGVVQTDGAMNIGAGKTYQVNGTQIATTNLGDVSSTPPSNGQGLIWNTSLGKYVPGAAGCNIATGSTTGCVMPDGTTVTVDGAGRLSVAGGSLTASCALTRYTVAFNDPSLNVASTTPTKTLVTMPNTSTRICALEISGTQSFAGTSCTAATVRVQSGAGTPMQYTPNQDIFGTVGPTTNNYWTDAGHIADRTNQNIVAAFTLTGCNGNALTAGSVDITVGLRAMP